MQEEKEAAIHDRVRRKLDATINPVQHDRKGKYMDFRVLTPRVRWKTGFRQSMLSPTAGEQVDEKTGKLQREYDDGVKAEVEEI